MSHVCSTFANDYRYPNMPCLATTYSVIVSFGLLLAYFVIHYFVYLAISGPMVVRWMVGGGHDPYNHQENKEAWFICLRVFDRMGVFYAVNHTAIFIILTVIGFTTANTLIATTWGYHS